MSTFATLSGNLQKAMKEGGVSNAIRYCNFAASPLVDSLEKLSHASIKRTSLNVRNPNNHPTDRERDQLLNYQHQDEAGEKLQPVIDRTGDDVTFYAPIKMMPLCESCHGSVGGKISIEDYGVIEKIYSSDKAVNYKNGDLRGMWSIAFHEELK